VELSIYRVWIDSNGSRPFPGTEEDDRNLTSLETLRVKTGERKSARKIVNLRRVGYELNMHD